jgi:hypothetical protein
MKNNKIVKENEQKKKYQTTLTFQTHDLGH